MGAQQGNLASMLLPLVVFVVIFYFMLIRPQKKRQAEHDKLIAGISRGDTVVTAGGFFGVVRDVLDDSFILEVDEGTKVRILKSSILMRKEAEKAAEPKKKGKKVVSEKTESSAAAQPEVKAEEKAEA